MSFTTKEQHKAELDKVIKEVFKAYDVAQLSIDAFKTFGSGSTAKAMRLDCAEAATRLAMLARLAADVPLDYEPPMMEQNKTHEPKTAANFYKFSLGRMPRQVEEAKRDEPKAEKPVVSRHMKVQSGRCPNEQASRPIQVGPIGSGIPTTYPFAIGVPLDHAFMRPCSGALWDSEYVDNEVNRLVFFQRPMAQSFAYYDQKENLSLNNKRPCDTNLNQSSMLDYPREFDVTGLGLFLPEDLQLMEFRELVKDAWIQLVFSGNRPLAELPVVALPSVLRREEALKMFQDTQRREPLTGVAPLVRNDGTPLVRIKPGEAFNVVVHWKSPPKIERHIKLVAALTGYVWRPE